MIETSALNRAFGRHWEQFRLARWTEGFMERQLIETNGHIVRIAANSPGGIS